jgi:ubiquinone/menaquinone biosynthesis C-methylase UbiE
VIVQAVDYLASLSPGLRRFIWRQTYRGVNQTFGDVNWSFLNYGFASLEPGVPRLALDERDEPDRDFIQMYHHAAASAEVAGKDVLEVSCGRGGGSSFIARYLGPRRVVAVDRAEGAIAFCASHHAVANLSFRVGDAESLPFDDASFDVVLNVESSHCYGSMVGFLREVRRVLRPGGHFSWADFRERRQLDALNQAFAEAGLAPVRTEDITPNVLASLDRTNARKVQAIRTLAPTLLVPLLKQFAGLPGSTIYGKFERREKVYQHCICRKD